MAKPETPEFSRLTPASKALVRRIGGSDDHEIRSGSGEPGRGWIALEDDGWITIRRNRMGGYAVSFTLGGWERWVRQCDVEDGLEPQPPQFG